MWVCGSELEVSLVFTTLEEIPMGAVQCSLGIGDIRILSFAMMLELSVHDTRIHHPSSVMDGCSTRGARRMMDDEFMTDALRNMQLKLKILLYGKKMLKL